MPRSLGNPDRDYSANSNVNNMIENLFVSPPLGLDKRFSGVIPIVIARGGNQAASALERVMEHWLRRNCFAARPYICFCL
jgi:hypothetical protein